MALTLTSCLPSFSISAPGSTPGKSTKKRGVGAELSSKVSRIEKGGCSMYLLRARARVRARARARVRVRVRVGVRVRVRVRVSARVRVRVRGSTVRRAWRRRTWPSRW